MTTTATQGVTADEKQAVNAEQNRSSQKANHEAVKKGAHVIWAYVKDKDVSLYAYRGIVNDHARLVKKGMTPAEKKDFATVLAKIADFVAGEDWEKEIKDSLLGSLKIVEAADYADFLYTFGLLTPGLKKKMDLNRKAETPRPVYDARNLPGMRIIKARCGTNRIGDYLVTEAGSKGFIDNIIKDLKSEETQTKLMKGIRDLADSVAVVWQHGRGSRIKGGLQGEFYAQIALGIVESRGQAENRMIDAGDPMI